MPTDDYELNPNQQAAVNYNDGPLLIVAGAGTGKTFTLVEKIKYLIKNNLAKPEEILCLTFTEKAAYEMEERVDRAMPYGYFQMNISTFHGFADEILKKEINHIGMNPAYNLSTQAQSIIFLRKNLFRFDLKYFRPLSNPNKFIEALLQHFSRLHDEDVDPREYLKWVESYSKSQNVIPAKAGIQKEKTGSRIPTSPLGFAGRGKSGMTMTDTHVVTKEEIEQLQELSNAYETYQQLKIENDGMDFDDLIYYLLKLFRKRPNILAEYKKQFKYLMVDEFQDTNIAQYQLIKLLAPSKENPKLTVVGDDSQAIYKFRGASISNILSFMKDYPQAHQISLNDNYRSNQNVLDKAYTLIKFNDPDTLEAKLGISKQLKGHKPNIKDGVNFELFEHSEDEADYVAKIILENKKKHGYEFKDFAILVRANTHSEPFIAALMRQGIPYQFLGPGTLFRQAEIKDLVSYLKVLTNLEDTVCLYRVLSMNIFKLDAEDIILLLSFAKKTAQPLFVAIEIYLSFYNEEWYKSEYHNYRRHLPLLKSETKDILMDFVGMVKRHIAKLNNDSAANILYYFLEDTGYLKKVANYETEHESKIAHNILKFLNLIKSIYTNDAEATVFNVVDYIDMSMELGESPISADTDVALSNAVNILTVHGSKGLEFPVVILTNLISGRFPTYERREAIPIPDSLIKETLPEGDYHLQEERRLFYVGLTRAMDRAYLSAAEIYGEGKRKRKISPFVIETFGTDEIEKKLSIKKTEKEQLSIFDFKKVEEPVQAPKLNLSQFSFSQLETYERCPLQYKYQYILKIPTPGNAAASFGSTIHNVLQKFYEGYIQDNTWNITQMMNLLASEWQPIGYSSQAHEQRMKKEAKAMLEKYFETFHKPEVEIMSLEKLFKIKVDDTLFLTGKIDRVDKLGDEKIEIIDYKTGKKPDEKELKKSLQLSIYALAATDEGLYKKQVEQVNLTFYYMQGMEKITMNKTMEDLANVKTEVKEITDRIKSGEFPAKVGPYCDFCTFRIICPAWQ